MKGNVVQIRSYIPAERMVLEVVGWSAHGGLKSRAPDVPGEFGNKISYFTGLLSPGL